jgi:hypothetical protein
LNQATGSEIFPLDLADWNMQTKQHYMHQYTTDNNILCAICQSRTYVVFKTASHQNGELRANIEGRAFHFFSSPV